jgi:hypothetical protein
MSSTTLETMFTAALADFGEALVPILTAILGVAALIMALVFGWKWVRRTIGRSK